MSSVKFTNNLIFKDSAMRTWTEAIIGGLTSNGGSLQWTPFVRRRFIRWAEGKGIPTALQWCLSITLIKVKEKLFSFFRFGYLNMIFFYSEIDPNLKETECVSVRETMNKKKYDMVIRPCDERISSICRKTDGKIIAPWWHIREI